MVTRAAGSSPHFGIRSPMPFGRTVFGHGVSDRGFASGPGLQCLSAGPSLVTSTMGDEFNKWRVVSNAFRQDRLWSRELITPAAIEKNVSLQCLSAGPSLVTEAAVDALGGGDTVSNAFRQDRLWSPAWKAIVCDRSDMSPMPFGRTVFGHRHPGQCHPVMKVVSNAFRQDRLWSRG